MLPRLFLFLLVATSAFADDLVWGGTWAGVWSNFGTSPYTAIDKDQNNKIIQIFCLDYNDEIAPPYEWLSNLNPLNQSNVTNFAQFGGNYGHGITTTPWAFVSDPGSNPGTTPGVNLGASPTAFDRYQEAAWLFTNIMNAQSAGDYNSMIISQVAAWDLFVECPNGTGTSGCNADDLRNRIAGTGGSYSFTNFESSNNSYTSAPGQQSFGGLLFQDAVDKALSEAQREVMGQGWFFSAYGTSWDLVTGDPTWTTAYNRPIQEFLTPTGTTGGNGKTPPVPEPASIFLLCTMVGCVAVAMRRKLQRTAA